MRKRRRMTVDQLAAEEGLRAQMPTAWNQPGDS